ncbi:MAG TPA: DNA-processing protein DprA, partial [Moraxellaceae bacterium]|nr:DNA-processing protein DprA [Moraxellaceae bacterium]
EIADPPPLLFFRGDPVLLGLPQVAIVGTRNPSLTGRADADAFAGELARAGLVITSGLARGVDAAAHRGAVRVRGRTIAVLGTGVDRPYPRENLRLFDSLLNGGGLVVSEFLPGEAPRAMNFPRRNRLISGLSLGVLVVEAAPESGSLITARRAAEQGRPVWVLPGSRHNVQAQGCLKLLRDGAAPVTEIAHILADLPPLLHLFQQEMADALPCDITLPATAAGPDALPLSSDMKAVLGALGEEPRHPDHVIGATGQAPASVLRTLSQLEIAGLIAAVPGGYARIPCVRRGMS